MKDQTERAIQVGHSTAAQAAEAARRAEVKLLILTHFSPRYEQEKANLLPGLLSEATEIFPNTILAEDLFVHEVPAH